MRVTAPESVESNVVPGKFLASMVNVAVTPVCSEPVKLTSGTTRLTKLKFSPSAISITADVIEDVMAVVSSSTPSSCLNSF